MTRLKPDAQFWEIADSFIEHANEHAGRADRGKVGAAMYQATARFTAYLAAAGAKDEASFRADRQKALDYFTAEFRKMLVDNLDDWSENFAKYTEKPPGAGT